jgi:hypothetical protein
MVSISEYNGLRDVILQQKNLVVSMFMNPLWPLRNNHRKHAHDVKCVVQELNEEFSNLPSSYAIVGHSMGGKVALLCASVVDRINVKAVLALDPVDMNPAEFTNENGENLTLNDDPGDNDNGGQTRINAAESPHHIPIVLTCTDGGLGISKLHDGEAIHKLHPNTEYHRHEHAGHMAYCDHGGGWAGKLIPDIGTSKGNENATKSAHELIRKILGNEDRANVV